MSEPYVSLREFEQRITALSERIERDIRELDKTMKSEFAHRDETLRVFLETYRKETEHLNQLRDDVVTDRAQLMTKEGDRKQLDTALKAIADRVYEIEKAQLGVAERIADQKVSEQRLGVLETNSIRRESQGLGQKLTMGRLVTVLGLAIAAISVIVVIANYVSSH
jgi:hypothetical protein